MTGTRGIGWMIPAILAALFVQPVAAQGFDPAQSPPQSSAVAVSGEQIAQAVAGLDDLAAEVMERSGIPGLAVVVVHAGEVVHAAGYGLRDTRESWPVDADTVFALASLSKPVSATVVAAQMLRGGPRWDSPVSRHLPEFALADPWVSAQVTIGDLFAHRSGLPDHAGDDLEDIGYARDEILRRLALLEPGAFRADYAYTNFGLTAGAEAVARAAGTSWEDLARQVLFEPLGMNATSARFSDFAAQANRAVGHTMTEAGFAPLMQREPDAQSPAGGVSASANDMGRWLAMVLGGGIVDGVTIVDGEGLLAAMSPQSVAVMPFATDARAGFYGFGFNWSVSASGRVVLGHSGAFSLGAGTSLMIIPSLDIGIVALSNAAPVGAVEALTASFGDLVQFGAITRDWFEGYSRLFAPLTGPVGTTAGQQAPAEAAPPRTPDAYVGRYANAYLGEVSVAAVADGLTLALGPAALGSAALGPAGQGHALIPWDGDQFVFEPLNENAPLGSRSLVTFAVDAQGVAQGLSIELFDESGWAELTRVP